LRIIALVPDVLARLVQLPKQRTEVLGKHAALMELRRRICLETVMVLRVDAVSIASGNSFASPPRAAVTAAGSAARSGFSLIPA
jgi:hypothetical protein